MPLGHVLGMLERETADTSIDGLVRSSYEQLGQNARRLFERLSVFPALASRAAEVKGVAKRIPGSKWVVDRRRPPDSMRR